MGLLAPGLTTAERERTKDLQLENRELRCANEILRKASAYFAWSSTADRSDGGIHRGAAKRPQGRADLQAAADRPVALRAQGSKRPIRSGFRIALGAMRSCAWKSNGRGKRICQSQLTESPNPGDSIRPSILD
jgi:hypothetical protein